MLEHIEYKQVTAYNCAVLVRYGERFRLMRERAKLSQEDVASALKVKKERGSSVSNIEVRVSRAPARAATILRHAKALRCDPWELLAGVPTAHDYLRAPTPLSDEEMSSLLWGLALVNPEHRRSVLANLQTFLEALPPDRVPPQAIQRAPAPLVKATRSGRGVKLA